MFFGNRVQSKSTLPLNAIAQRYSYELSTLTTRGGADWLLSALAIKYWAGLLQTAKILLKTRLFLF